MSSTTEQPVASSSTSTSSKRLVRVALLLCDTPLPVVQASYGNYLPIFTSHLQDSLKTLPSLETYAPNGVELQVDGFDVITAMEYPDWEEMKRGEKGGGYTALMMTGSAHSAHNDSLPWLPKLVNYVKTIATSPETSHIKILGTCFGMQVIARALGSSCIPNPLGWEIGVYEIELTQEGKKWLTGVPGESDMEIDGDASNAGSVKEKDKVAVQQMHRDHVPTVPPGFLLLASTPKCKVHGFIQYYPTSPKAHIFGIQGHPEFIPQIVNHMIDVRSASGVFDPETAKEARKRAGWLDGGEGRGRVGWAMLRMILE